MAPHNDHVSVPRRPLALHAKKPPCDVEDQVVPLVIERA
jgi:hypothetical protein